MASVDDGFTSFSLEWDTSSSTVRATGRDNAGFFSIFGLFDGKDLRLIKQYAFGEWKYIGAATEQGEGVYNVSGAWGTGNVQYGSFALSMLGVGSGGASQVSSAVRLEGEWMGAYLYSSGPQEHATKLYLAVKPGRKLRGAGRDDAGAFTLAGIYDGKKVTMYKTYSENDTRWKYQGNIDPGGARLRGNWGNESQDFGTFWLMKGRAIADAQAQEFMPNTDELLERGSTAGVRDLLEQGGSSSLANGFTELWS